jgi:hypothetical protein
MPYLVEDQEGSRCSIARFFASLRMTIKQNISRLMPGYVFRIEKGKCFG